VTTSSPFGHGGGGDAVPGEFEEAIDELTPEELDAAAAAAAIESDFAQLQHERSELVDTLRRVQADFENYRKRMIREQTTLVERATERLVEELLPVLDSFDGALAHASADAPEKLVDGLNGIHAQLVSVLDKHGLERMASDGAPFDPNEHEAVMSDDGPAEPSVAETMRAGYRMEGRVVRPAMERVTRAG